jgi:hypothetical protein
MSNMFQDRFCWRELNWSDPDLGAYEQIFESNNDPKNPDVLRWRFRVGPTGHSLLLLAEDASKLECPSASFYAIFGVPFRVGSNVVTAGQSIDTLTDKEYRGKGLFVWLASEAYRIFIGRGGKLVYGFPNQNVHRARVAHLHWHMLNPLPLMLRPLRSGYFLRAGLRLPQGVANCLDFRIGGFHRESREQEQRPILERLTGFGPEHDELWRQFSSGIAACVERTADFMNWRITKHPMGKYRMLGAYREGRLAAEIIWCIERKHGGTIGYVMELLHRPGDLLAGRVVVAACLSEMRAANVDAALAWNMRHSPNSAIFRSAGFFPLPERVRPFNFYWGFRSFDSNLDAILRDRRNWYISYIDSDTT